MSFLMVMVSISFTVGCGKPMEDAIETAAKICFDESSLVVVHNGRYCVLWGLDRNVATTEPSSSNVQCLDSLDEWLSASHPIGALRGELGVQGTDRKGRIVFLIPLGERSESYREVEAILKEAGYAVASPEESAPVPWEMPRSNH
jgi:hypothetical protein